MTTYRLWRTATLVQFKDVVAPQGTSEDDVIAVSHETPWQTARVATNSGTDIEELE
jgi:hypothetical protein